MKVPAEFGNCNTEMRAHLVFCTEEFAALGQSPALRLDWCMSGHKGQEAYGGQWKKQVGEFLSFSSSW